MPDPESRKAFFDRQRWRRARLSTQQLRLLVLVLLAVGAAVQGFFFIQEAWSELQDVHKTIGQSTAWRSANYSFSQDLADFLQFLQRRIPADGTVIWPGQDSASRLPGATFMQVLLYPRKISQCPASGCEEMSLAEKDFFVTAGNFPGEKISQQATQSEQFNARWGLLTFDPGGFRGQAAAARFQSLFQALLAALLPTAWMLLLAICGAVFVTILQPQADFYRRAALGFGLGMGIFTMAAGLVSLAGLVLRVPVILLITATLAAGAILAWQLVRKKRTRETIVSGGMSQPADEFTRQNKPGDASAVNASSAQPSNGRREVGVYPEANHAQKAKLDGWVLVFVGLAAISALVAVGKGYRVSDELLIWAPKGYGIASTGTLAGVTGWGTNTLPYPLHVPILIAAFNLLFGDILPAAKLVFSAYYLALLVLSYSFLRGTGLRTLAAGCCTLLVATAPLIFRHSTIAYANLPFSFYLVTAGILLAQAVAQPASASAGRTYLLSGLFFMLAAWTRPEGIWMAWLLLVCVAGFTFIRRRQLAWRDWIWLAAPLLFYQGFWWLVTQSAYREGVERSQIGLRAAETVLAGNLHLQEGAYLLVYGVGRLLDFENWGVWGAGLLILALAGMVYWRRGGAGDRLVLAEPGLVLVNSGLVFLQGWLVVGMVIAMYYVASYDRNHDISWWVSTGLERMLFPGLLLLWLGGIQLVNSNAGRANSSLYREGGGR